MIILKDTFSRTLSGAVGDAETGTDPSKTWQPGQFGSSLANFSVDGSQLIHNPATTSNTTIKVGTDTTADIDLYVEVNGFVAAGVFHTVKMTARHVSDSYYDLRFHNDQDALDNHYVLQIYKIVNLNVANANVRILGQTRVDSFIMRGQVQTLPDRVAVRLKKWLPGTPEPAAWDLTYTDFGSDRFLTGACGLMANNGGVADSVKWDNFTVQTIPQEALVAGDRIKETTTTTGTGTITLDGAASGFQTFSVIANHEDRIDRVAYAIVGTTEWEVGIGTWLAGNYLRRTDVIASSNAGALVNFSAGTKDVFNQLPAPHGTLPVISRLQGMNMFIPRDTTTYAPDDYEIASGYALEIDTTAGLEIG